MDTFADSTDCLAACTIIEDYGNIRYVMTRQPQSQLATLMPALTEQSRHNSKLFYTFRISSIRSYTQSTVQARRHSNSSINQANVAIFLDNSRQQLLYTLILLWRHCGSF